MKPQSIAVLAVLAVVCCLSSEVSGQKSGMCGIPAKISSFVDELECFEKEGIVTFQSVDYDVVVSLEKGIGNVVTTLENGRDRIANAVADLARGVIGMIMGGAKFAITPIDVVFGAVLNC